MHVSRFLWTAKSRGNHYGKVDPNEAFTGQFKLKAITELLDQESILDQQVLTLLTWSAQYYHSRLVKSIQKRLPTFSEQGRALDILFHLWKSSHTMTQCLIKTLSKTI